MCGLRWHLDRAVAGVGAAARARSLGEALEVYPRTWAGVNRQIVTTEAERDLAVCLEHARAKA
jgi:hypothetical protein